MERHRGLNIAALSRRTGVAPDTLRKWEQRYGVLRPSRTPGGQRRYSEDDVSRVAVAPGPALARATASARRRSCSGAARPRWPARPPSSGPRCSRRSRAERPGGDRTAARPGVHARPARGDARRRRRAGARAGRRGVGRPASSRSPRSTCVSGAVRARLERQLADARGGVRGVAVLACAPGERHDLGLLMLAVLLRADGWQVAYLGADTPLEDAIGLAAAVSARMLCLSGREERARRRCKDELAAHELPPGVRARRRRRRRHARALRGAGGALRGLEPASRGRDAAEAHRVSTAPRASRAGRRGRRDRVGAARAARPAALPLRLLGRRRCSARLVTRGPRLAPGRVRDPRGERRRLRARLREIRRLTGAEPRRLALGHGTRRARRALPALRPGRSLPPGPRRARASRRCSRNPRAFAQATVRHACSAGARPAGALSAGQGRSTARRGPARKPASSRSGISSVSATGRPSKRSTASRLAPPPRT